MTALEAVVLVFGPEKLTNRQIRERTGIPMKNVAAYIVKLRKRGIVARVGDGKRRPFIYQMIDNAVSHQAQKVVDQAKTQPMSVFHLADPADRLGFEPFDYCERS